STFIAGYFHIDGAEIQANQYAASINWGDGSNADTGTVQPDGNGEFNIIAPPHTFDHPGSKAVTVTVTGFSGTLATINSTANVADAAVTGTPLTVTPTE